MADVEAIWRAVEEVGRETLKEWEATQGGIAAGAIEA